jgi:hypothetical protein
MLKGFEIDKSEIEREVIRRHQHFVTSLKEGKRNWRNNSRTFASQDTRSNS